MIGAIFSLALALIGPFIWFWLGYTAGKRKALGLRDHEKAMARCNGGKHDFEVVSFSIGSLTKWNDGRKNGIQFQRTESGWNYQGCVIVPARSEDDDDLCYVRRCPWCKKLAPLNEVDFQVWQKDRDILGIGSLS